MDVAQNNYEADVPQRSRIVANPSPVASLPLQIFITWDYYVQCVFSFVTAVLLLYKVYQFSFPSTYFFLEALLLAAL